jgi:regulatory protein
VSDAKSINELNADLFQPEEVDRFANPKEARKKAMDYLARREYGHDELVAKLANAGYDADIAAAEVDRLTDEGLQSDERFAGSFVQSRVNQGKGPVRIRQELKEKGLRTSVTEDALRENEQDWFELAREVRVRKFGMNLPADFTEKARQMRFLQYRGFESEQIQVAVQSHGDD